MKQMSSRFEALENERQGGGKGRGREAA
jgi:hypothetical protein